MTSLSMPASTHTELIAHLSSSKVEQVAFLFTEQPVPDEALRVREMYQVPREGFDFQSDYVVALTDELRGQVVKAYIEVAPGYEPGEPLADEIKQFVRTRLAAHEYPRQIEFIEALPMTSTGKIRRNVLRDQSATAGAGQQPHTT